MKKRGENPSQQARQLTNEIEELEDNINNELRNISKDINQRKKVCSDSVDKIDHSIHSLEIQKKQILKGTTVNTVDHRDKKMREMRVEFMKLDQVLTHLEEDKIQILATTQHLKKEIKSVETSLFNTKQLIYRDMEKFF